MRLVGSLILGGSVLALAMAAPVAGHPRLDFTEESTSVACKAVPGEAGTVRLTASVSSLSGSAGFLLFWDAAADPALGPPTLVSLALHTTLQADGSLLASYDMFIPGDLGVTEAEPIFVGTAQLTTTLSATGPAELIDQVNRNGNSQFRIQGTSQTLGVAGSVTVPTAASFDLAGCTGEREVLAFFATQPDADVSTIDRTRLDCFWVTDDGFVVLEAQADENDVFVAVLVLDASGVSSGLSVPSLSPAGIDAAVSLDSTGSATISADFTSGERVKFMERTDDGWVMVTLDQLLAAGTIAIDAPGASQTLAMDEASCLADARKVISLAIAPGPRPQAR